MIQNKNEEIRSYIRELTRMRVAQNASENQSSLGMSANGRNSTDLATARPI